MLNLEYSIPKLETAYGRWEYLIMRNPSRFVEPGLAKRYTGNFQGFYQVVPEAHIRCGNKYVFKSFPAINHYLHCNVQDDFINKSPITLQSIGDSKVLNVV